MSTWFASPWGLLGLLGVPAVLAIHLYHHRFPRTEVAGLHLWSAEAESRSAGRRRDRLPITATLLLELLLALILGLLLARPRFDSAVSGVHQVVVLDSSASMSAAPPGGVSFRDAAVNELRQRRRDAGRGGLATLILTGPRPELLAGPQATWDEALAALERWQPRHAAHDVRPAWDLAAELDPAARLTDHQPELQAPAEMEVLAVGRPLQNLSFSSARWTLTADGTGGELFLRISSHSSVPLEPELTVSAGEQTVLRQSVALPANGSTPLKVPLPGGLRELTVELRDASDALALDSRVRLIEPQQRPLTVAQQLPENYPGRRAVADALAGMPGIQPGPADQAHLVIAPAGSTPPLNPDIWWLGLGPLKLTEADRKSASDLLGPYLLEKKNPLLDGVVLGGVVWGGVQPAGEELQPLISAGKHMLLAELMQAAGRAWQLNIDLSRSNLTESPDWPILLSNLLGLRRDSLPGLRRFNYRINEVIRFRMPTHSTGGEKLGSGLLELVHDGDRRPLAPGRIVELPALDDPGLYEVEGVTEDGERVPAGRFAVNFFDAAESDLRGLSEASVAVDSANDTTAVSSPYTLAVVAGLVCVLLLALWDWRVVRKSPG